MWGTTVSYTYYPNTMSAEFSDDDVEGARLSEMVEDAVSVMGAVADMLDDVATWLESVRGALEDLANGES